MSQEQLKEQVDRIIGMAGDDEAAHSKEDDLHRTLLSLYLPVELSLEIQRLNNANFARWCA